MAENIKFPSLSDSVVEEFRPAVDSVIRTMMHDSLRHITSHQPELLQLYGADVVTVLCASILQYIGDFTSQDAIKSLGQERFYIIRKEITR